MRELDVYYNDTRAGALKELNPGACYSFTYDPAYLESDLPPVSVTLPKREEAFESDLLFPFFSNMPLRSFARKLEWMLGVGRVLKKNWQGCQILFCWIPWLT